MSFFLKSTMKYNYEPIWFAYSWKLDHSIYVSAPYSHINTSSNSKQLSNIIIIKSQYNYLFYNHSQFIIPDRCLLFVVGFLISLSVITLGSASWNLPHILFLSSNYTFFTDVVFLSYILFPCWFPYVFSIFMLLVSKLKIWANIGKKTIS